MEASHDWNYLLECLEQSSLTECIDGDIDEGVSGLDQEELVALVNKWLERGLFTGLMDTILGQNLQTLAQQIGLSDDEVSVFGFLILCQQQFLLSIVVTRYGKLNRPQLCQLVSRITGINISRVSEALSPKGLLVKAQLVKLNPAQDYLNEKVSFINHIDEAFADSILSAADICNLFLHPITEIKLQVEDYGFLAKEFEYLVPYLKNAIDHKTKGCNVLLYGPPGTGKTELAKAFSKKVESDLFEVKTERSDYIPIDPHERMESYLLGTLLLENKGRNLILFDELEDIIRGESPGVVIDSKQPLRSKSWFNRLLETNSVPTIWTCNSIKGIDSAYLRRFDVILEIGVAPREYRNRMIKSIGQNIASENTWVEFISTSLPITAADVSRVSKVTQMASSHKNAHIHATRLLQNSYSAVIGNNINLENAYQNHATDSFNVNWLNTSCNIIDIQHALIKGKRGRICLYGPPGTGKTQFAYDVAKKADMPILAKKASDLVSCYMGETERNIAKAFRQAECDNALLLIDEVDSFLSDRRNHQRVWETSQVNELLVQMEQFNGIFIAATNLIDNLDFASLRRFDFKIKFDYPTHEQVWDMFCHNFNEPHPAHKEQLKMLGCLTPGNFHVAKRQAKLLGKTPSPESFLDILREEAKSNQLPNHPIGFIH